MLICSETAFAGKTLTGNSKRFTLFFKYKNMPVEKFGRRDTAVQEIVSSDVSFTQIGDYFIRRDGSNTAIGSINMTGNTLTNVSVPVHDHDATFRRY